MDTSLVIQNVYGGKQPVVYLHRVDCNQIKTSSDIESSNVSDDSANSKVSPVKTTDTYKEVSSEIKYKDEEVNNTTINGEDEATIGQGVNFVNKEFVKENLGNPKKKNVNIQLLEQKRIDREVHQKEIQEKQYKRLMHLLSQSKAFSNFMTSRFKEGLDQKNKKVNKKRKLNLQNHDSSLNKKEKSDYNILSKKNESYIKLKLNTDKIAEELESMSDEEVDNNKENIESIDNYEQSKYFKGILRDYQKVGLNWLKILYENGLNGILADEMGLGKTIQIIALFAYLIERRICGPYLIIVPLSTLSNWISEFERFAPQIPVVVCYKSFETVNSLRTKLSKKVFLPPNCSTYPVVLTTYNSLVTHVSLLRLFHWKYIVIDEAQRIKNYKCQLFKIVKRFDSINRLLLTGTPLQNNLSELWSLLNFLLPDIFNDLDVFESWFDAKQVQDENGKKKLFKQEEEKHVLSTLREILDPFLLRRLKEDVCSDIPLNKEVIIYAPLTKLQYDLYSAVLNKNLNRYYVNEYESSIIDVNGVRPKRKCTKKLDIDNYNQEKRNHRIHRSINKETEYSSADLKEIQIWNKFIKVSDENINYLRKLKLASYHIIYRHIVNHPYIIYNPMYETGQRTDNEDILKCSGKLLVLDAMLKNLKSNNHKVLIFSTMSMVLDIIEECLFLRNYKYVRLDGNVQYDKRKENIQKFNTDPEIFVFLLTTKAGGVGLNLTAADTVIIYDSDWNPQNDLQAMARCHRIGQTKQVATYRLCTKGTIDEEIIKRASVKRFLEKAVISKEESLVNSVVGLTYLKELLENNSLQLLSSKGNVYTEAELNKLLDRNSL